MYAIKKSFKPSSNDHKSAEAPTDFRAACEVQQNLAETCVLHSKIVWDVIAPDQSELLIKKLDCLFPHDKKVYTSTSEIRKAKKYNAYMKDIKDKLFNNIWQQRKYTNGALWHSIIYILFTTDINMENAKHTHEYTVHPVFRTLRCLKNNSSAGCCMIFIDEQAHIYQNWNDFIKNNELPKGIMIAPKNGYYSLDDANKVNLEYSFTPAYLNKALRMTDNIITFASAVSAVATVFNPFFSVAVIGTQTYHTIRNHQKMSNKVQRGVATNIKSKFSLTRDILNLISSVATFGAYMSVRPGNKLTTRTGMTLQTMNTAVTIINSANLILNTFDLFTKYFLDEEELVFSDVLEFGSSLILFTNSINNIAITSQIGKVNGNTLRSLIHSKIKAGLIVVSETIIQIGGQNAGSFDLLRLINDIPYKDVLCNMHTIYSNLNPTGFLMSLSLLGAVANEIIPGLHVDIFNKEITRFDLNELAKHYGLKFVQHIANPENLIDILNGIGVYFSPTILQYLLNQTRVFIEMIDKLYSQQNCFISTEIVLHKLFIYIIKNYKNYTYEFLDMKKDEILLGVTNLFKYLNPIRENKNAEQFNCNVCGGLYYLVNV